VRYADILAGTEPNEHEVFGRFPYRAALEDTRGTDAGAMFKIAAAAIERLEAERQRRVEERIAQGKAIRVPLCVVVSDPGREAAERER
jgi:hypothetical protein